MTKKIVALLLALLMVLSMTACAKTETPADKPADEPAVDTPADEPADEPAAEPADEEVAEIVYFLYGNSDSSARPEVEAAINAYIEPLINTNVTFNMIASGDWSQKAITALQSGDRSDVIFTADWYYYMNLIDMGLLTPLNDDAGEYGNLIETYGQGILETINPAFITGTQVDGINYAVPTNKELCVPMGWIYNVTAAEAIGLTKEEAQKITKSADWEPWMAKYKEANPSLYPYLSDGSWGDELWVGVGYGNLFAHYIDPKADGTWDTTIYNKWETQGHKDYVAMMNKWWQAGWVHPDSPLSSFGTSTGAEFTNGQFLFISAPLKGENIKAQELIIASGNQELKLDEVYGQGKYVITTHSGGSMLGIPTTSEEPVAAMKYINLMHTDSNLLDMMLFGVEGTHWTREADGRVAVSDSVWYGAHGGAWTMGNTAIQSVTNLEDPEKNQKLQSYSADAVPHCALGFRYVVPAELENVKAALDNLNTEYGRALNTGSMDVSKVDEYVEKCKAAGADDLLADITTKFEAWYAKVNG